jgi:hypothetical protein
MRRVHELVDCVRERVTAREHQEAGVVCRSKVEWLGPLTF